MYLNVQEKRFKFTLYNMYMYVGDIVALWLASWSPDQKVWVLALAGPLCCVLRQDTLYSHSASLHPGV